MPIHVHEYSYPFDVLIKYLGVEEANKYSYQGTVKELNCHLFLNLETQKPLWIDDNGIEYEYLCSINQKIDRRWMKPLKARHILN